MSTKVHVDDGKIYFNTYQDVEDIIENNKRLQTEAQHGEFRHVASIPTNILYKWLREEQERGNVGLRWSSPEFDRLVQRKLRDPEWAYLRTDAPYLSGRVGFGD